MAAVITGTFASVIRHPLYDLFEPTWTKLGHVREGTGGFLDGTYLIAHPREWEDHTAAIPKKPTKKLKARRALASYTNYADAILDSKKSALFREAPTRRVGAGETDELTDLERWWKDVDGQGTAIDKAVPLWWDVAATFGHCLLYVDLPTDEGGQPVVRVYSPLDVVNWLQDDNGRLTAIMVLEVVPPAAFEDTSRTQVQLRVIDTEGWQVYAVDRGQTITSQAVRAGTHGLGVLPVVTLYGKRRSAIAELGQSILGDPQNHIDLYNLESELRELLRNQTFSFVNIPLGTGADAMNVEAAMQMLGQQTGTMNVLFSGLQAQVLSGDAANVAAYQAQHSAKVRAVYRESGASWESDSKDAEAMGSLELKREELNTRLAGYADECQQADVALAKLFYRWRYGADRGEQRFDDDDVTIQYPDRFGATPFEDVLHQVQAAQSIGMPALFLKELRKAIVAKFEGMASLTPEVVSAIMDAIDNAPDDPTPAERMQQRMELMDKAARVGGKPPAVPPDVGKA